MVANDQLAPSQILAHIKTSQRLHPQVPAAAETEQTLVTLLEGDIELEGVMPWSSNYTFLARLNNQATQTRLLAIYKPGQGERPLWDFPEGKLCYREFASYLVSQVLGWPNIPPTVLRKGPHGLGSVQLFIDAEYEAHYFNMRHISALAEDFRRMALFDYIVNNADRKGGHCLKDKEGQIWAIDHGLTFHTEFKLRTVIWEFSEEEIPTPLCYDLERLKNALGESAEWRQVLSYFIRPKEIQAFKRRVERLLSAGHLPELHSGRNVPFPPI